MADTPHGLREQLLSEHECQHSHHVSEQPSIRDTEPMQEQRVDSLTSQPDSQLNFQPYAGFKIPEWPEHPLPLTQTSKTRIVSIGLDIALLIFALLFLALAIGALVVNKRGIGDDSGRLVEQASRLGPTVFPIIFAALVGRALKAIGRFRSEKEIQVSTLWAFLSTKTVFDALLLQWSIGALSLPTIFMGILWAMSPAGGQASLRVLYHGNKTSFSTTNIRYMDTGPLGLSFTYRTLVEGYDIIPGHNNEDFPFSMSNSLAAALMQNVETKSGPRDLWGNPKIPRLHILNHTTADENGWIQVPQSPKVESFSSLFGLPLLGIPDHGTVEFDIESAYVEFGPVPIEQGARNLTATSLIEATCTCPDFSNHLDQATMMIRTNQLLGPPWTQLNSSQLSQESLTGANIVQFKQPKWGITVSSRVTQVLIETHIVCDDGLCRATKIRPSTTDHRPENITVFDLWGELALDMLQEANGKRTGSPTLLELFLNDTSTIPVSRTNAMFNITQEDWPNIADAGPEMLSERITLLLNSALNILYSSYGFAGTLPSVDSMDYGPPHIPANGLSAVSKEYNISSNPDFGGGEYVAEIVDNGAPFVGASAEAFVTQKHAIYKADYTYVAILVVSSLALTMTGLVGMIMGLRTRGPDVFDPLMGLTYNNHYLGLMNPGSTLDTNTRAKLLKGMKVRLGDVAGGGSVGIVGIGRTSEVEPFARGRLYE